MAKNLDLDMDHLDMNGKSIDHHVDIASKKRRMFNFVFFTNSLFVSFLPYAQRLIHLHYL